jgi:indolepyruvate ferredoxin oxidoreductase
MRHADITLDDKYVLEDGQVFITGIQALVRLTLDQRRADRAVGLNTAGFVSGYRGSPLGGLDQQMHKAGKHLRSHDIVFKEGLNEDLAATAVWGSQQTNVFPGARVDGVFGLWYGKAPGVDRTGDVFKHANFAGVSPRGGVLAICGDDHACKSSTLPSQSEYTMMDAEIPVLAPYDIQDVLDFGLYGLAMSRFSGAWTSMIALADTMDSGATISVTRDRLNIVTPHDFVFPADGVHIRAKDIPIEKERRHRHFKLPAALAFARANGLDKVTLQPQYPKLGLVVVGPAYREVLEAFAAMGISLEQAADLGVGIFKVAMPWPLEPEGIRAFCKQYPNVLVIEHKRNVVERQLKEALYTLSYTSKPNVEGKTTVDGKPLLSEIGALSVPDVASALFDRLPRGSHDERAKAYLDRALRAKAAAGDLATDTLRRPFYCSGCPHNSSTVVPDGSRALAGIGCHYMANFMDRNTDMTSQMGGEGVSWIGQSPFTDERHVFVNLGDGTYSHSGSLAIRASVAAKTNITYKILYNDAVAMTGGQNTETGFTVSQIARQVRDEGVETIIIVTDDPTRYEVVRDLPPGVPVEHRRDLEHIQKRLRDTAGVTVIIYDQTCAAEKRRRRKRGTMAKSTVRALINPAVCEGCGDCSKKSNCVSVEPLETEMGRKRRINQSTCNQDISCVEGFCPSFVTVTGAELAKKPVSMPALDADSTPMPEIPVLDHVCNIVFTGVGGTGVTTVASVLAMAAHVDGRAASVVDMTGLAQKGGAVFSHVRIGRDTTPIGGRVPAASADVLIGCDLIVAASGDAIGLMDKDRTRAVGNLNVAPTADFVTNRDKRFDTNLFQGRVERAVADFDGTMADQMAESFLGDTIFSNMVMLGFAWQKGLVPVSARAMARAITLNGAAVEKNLQAFELGRKAFFDPASVAVHSPEEGHVLSEMTLDALIAHRTADLVSYQDQAYADRYAGLVARVRTAEQALGSEALTRAVATYAYKLMAIKDEYEVARLYTDGRFEALLKETFKAGGKIQFQLAPPILSPKNKATGEPMKIALGPWMMSGFKLLTRFKGLRGGALDIFGKTAERRMERKLRDDYLGWVDSILPELTADNLKLATEIASIPDQIRGYGHVKEASVKLAEVKAAELLAKW